jgi:hypothetical protein
MMVNIPVAVMNVTVKMAIIAAAVMKIKSTIMSLQMI